MSKHKNKLPELSEKSGIGVRYTNHSLRAAAIMCMFNGGLPEKIIPAIEVQKL